MISKSSGTRYHRSNNFSLDVTSSCNFLDVSCTWTYIFESKKEGTWETISKEGDDDSSYKYA